MNKEFVRGNNGTEVYRFCNNFIAAVGAENIIIKDVDESGKTLKDYMMTGHKKIVASQLRDAELMNALKASAKKQTAFDEYGHTKTSAKAYDSFRRIVGKFANISSCTLSKSSVSDITQYDSSLKLAEGLKTSRAFNRVCETYGVTKAEPYNKLFASYADMVSDLKRELTYVISLNPYDYLTMSFGNSWASCHTIDKTNRRGMDNAYSGAYCGGCLSYMLDSTSFITFTVEKGADVQTSGKIFRNMFHYGNNVLVQGRVYPQSNDGGTDLYQAFREIVQAEMATMLDLTSNEWTHLCGYDSMGSYVNTSGVHYPDYRRYNGCNASYPSERRRSGAVRIGHNGICPYCGEEYSKDRLLSHDSCSLN
jgi:hypothetical protein